MTKQQHIIVKQIQKHDIEANWLKAVNFIPEKGRLIIYDTEVDAEGNTLELPENRTTPYTYERFKIGDGIHNVSELPINDYTAGSGNSPWDNHSEMLFETGSMRVVNQTSNDAQLVLSADEVVANSNSAAWADIISAANFVKNLVDVSTNGQ